MLKLTAIKDQAKERAAQIEALNFNWFDKKPQTQERIQEYADIIYERVKDVISVVNPVNYLFSTGQGQLGKTIRFKENYGGRVYSRSYGEYKKAGPVKANFYNITTVPKALHLDYPVEDLKAGVVLTSELVDMAVKAILHYRMKIMWRALKDGLNTSNTYCTNVGTGLTGTELLTAINDLGDTCAVQAIIGRRSFLGNLVTFTGYDGLAYPDSVKEEIHNTGWVSSFAGAMVLGLEAFPDDVTNENAIDNGNVFILGSKTKNWNRWVEVTTLQAAQEVKPSDGSFHLYYDFEDGFAVWKTKYMRRLWDGQTANA